MAEKNEVLEYEPETDQVMEDPGTGHHGVNQLSWQVSKGILEKIARLYGVTLEDARALLRSRISRALSVLLKVNDEAVGGTIGEAGDAT